MSHRRELVIPPYLRRQLVALHLAYNIHSANGDNIFIYTYTAKNLLILSSSRYKPCFLSSLRLIIAVKYPIKYERFVIEKKANKSAINHARRIQYLTFVRMVNFIDYARIAHNNTPSAINSARNDSFSLTSYNFRANKLSYWSPCTSYTNIDWFYHRCFRC